MPRLNIDDDFWDAVAEVTPRVGDHVVAVGLALKWIRLAQRKHLAGMVTTPEEFEPFAALAPEFARVDEVGAHPVGPAAQFDWLSEKKAQASRAGQASAASRKKKSGTAVPSNARNLKMTERKPNGTERRRTKTERHRTPPNATEPSSSSSSSSLPLLDYKNLSPNLSEGAPASPPPPPPPPPSAKDVIARFCDGWNATYPGGQRFTPTPKDVGLLTTFAKAHGFARATQLIDAFFRMPDPWFVTKAHDVATFVGSTAKVLQFMNSGKIVTRKLRDEIQERVDLEQDTGRVDHAAIAENYERELKAKQLQLRGEA